MVIAAESIFLKPAPWPRIAQSRRSCPVWAGWEVRFQNLCFSSLTAVFLLDVQLSPDKHPLCYSHVRDWGEDSVDKVPTTQTRGGPQH